MCCDCWLIQLGRYYWPVQTIGSELQKIFVFDSVWNQFHYGFYLCEVTLSCDGTVRSTLRVVLGPLGPLVGSVGISYWLLITVVMQHWLVMIHWAGL